MPFDEPVCAPGVPLTVMNTESAVRGGGCALFPPGGIFLAAALLPIGAVTVADAFGPGGAGPKGLLPLAAAGALGALLLITSGARAAAYAVAILGTCPSWYLAARAAPAPTGFVGLSLAGLAHATLVGPARPGLRRLALVGSAAAAAAAGRSVGLVVAVAVPSLSVGLAGLLAERAAPLRVDPWRRILARVLVGLAAALALLVLVAWLSPRSSGTAWLRVLLGREGSPSPLDFADLVARQGYGLIPWSSLLPFAFVVRREPRVEGAVRTAFLLVAVLTLGVAALVPSAQASVGPVCAATFAVGIGLLLQRLDREGTPFPLAAMAVVAFAALVGHDLALAPERLPLTRRETLPADAVILVRAARGAVIALGAAAAAGMLVRPVALRHLRGMLLAAVGLLGALHLRASDIRLRIPHAAHHAEGR